MLNKGRRALEKLIAPGSILSYSQSGEDLVLDFLTGYAPTGFYVDVGCNHPVSLSNSYRFYRKGWAGICVDANPKFVPLFASKRPRDRFVSACVSDKPERVSFTMFAGDALSSISGKRLYDNPKQYAVESVRAMNTRTLTDILTEANCPPRFDFLSIDVEGHDEAVLRGLDLSRFHPNVIVIELHDAEIGSIARHPVSEILADYEPIAAHWSNIFFRLPPT